MLFITFDSMEKEKPKKKINWSAIIEYAVLALLAVAVYFTKDFSSETINFPGYITYYLAGAIALAVIIVRFKKFEQKYVTMHTIGERLFYAFLSLTGVAIGAWILASMAFVPLNYYNIHKAKQNKADTVYCEIDSAHIGIHKGDTIEANTIYYKFNNAAISLKTEDETPLLTNMRWFHSASLYQLKLAVHNALFNSYWISYWKVVSKDTVKQKTIQP